MNNNSHTSFYMKEQSQNIRDEKLFRFASAKRYLKIFVPEFAFKHDKDRLLSDNLSVFCGRHVFCFR